MLVESILAGSTALGAATFAGIHAFMPTSQLYGATFTHARDNKLLALTYDDGPNDPHTLHLLDVLAEFDVHATFFVIGDRVKQRPDILQRVSAAGHAIGNHTYSHPNLAFCSVERTRQEIKDCEKAITDVIPSWSNKEQKIFRCPFGGRRPATLKIVRELGYVPIQWDVTCFDWKQTTAERVAGHAQRLITGGNVILLHDGGHIAMGADRAHTVQATRSLLQRYKNEGFRFVTMPEMMQL